MSQEYVTDCDYCGEIALCHDDGSGGTRCGSCKRRQEEKALTSEDVEYVIIDDEDWLKQNIFYRRTDLTNQQIML